MGEPAYAGIDLTFGRRPAAAAALAEGLAWHELAMPGSDEELVEFVRRHGARIVGIDAPLSLPAGLCCLEAACACGSSGPGSGRECERALARLGIGCYFTTKRSIIKEMVYRGMRLKRRLEAEGLAVIEVYPYASKVRLFGKPLPRKSSAQG